MLREGKNQSHTRWYCKYHVVIATYRRKALYGVARKEIGLLIREVCNRYRIEAVEGHVMRDHIHMLG